MGSLLFRQFGWNGDLSLSAGPIGALGKFALEVNTFGAVRVPGALVSAQLDRLWREIESATAFAAAANRSEVYAARALLSARPQLRETFVDLKLDDVAAAALGRAVFPIDALFFDKHRDANWAVPAHQDVVVPVPPNATRTAVRNLKNRHGRAVGEPSVEALDELVAVRVHFDHSDKNNGCLAVIPGSHTRGRLSDSTLRDLPPEAFHPYECSAGDLLLMKPLVVHRSPRARHPAHRRVLHILYAPRDGWHAGL